MSAELKLSADDARYIEGYAKGLTDLLEALTGDSPNGKSYDPMRIDLERGVMCSYAFNMKDGGRTHPIRDYISLDEICDILLRETAEYSELPHTIRESYWPRREAA